MTLPGQAGCTARQAQCVAHCAERGRGDIEGHILNRARGSLSPTPMPASHADQRLQRPKAQLIVRMPVRVCDGCSLAPRQSGFAITGSAHSPVEEPIASHAAARAPPAPAAERPALAKGAAPPPQPGGPAVRRQPAVRPVAPGMLAHGSVAEHRLLAEPLGAAPTARPGATPPPIAARRPE